MRLYFRRLFLIFTLLFSISDSAQSRNDSVQFQITEISSKAIGEIQEKIWLATHQSANAVAKFQITLQLKRPSGSSPFTFSKGSIQHVEGSNPKEFIRQLSMALMAKSPKMPKTKVQNLPFETAILGLGLSRINDNGQLSGGAFTSQPTGAWIATKIFLAGGAGEVFLNLDPNAGVGEFSIKDEGYGNIVIQELSRVL